MTQASGNLVLGIDDASGPNGGLGALKAQTNSFTPVTGWNTANVTAPVSLLAELSPNFGDGLKDQAAAWA